jgi:flagellar biosynthesis protein FliR
MSSLLFIRILGFVLAFWILPRRLVPVPVKLAFALALILFLLPQESSRFLTEASLLTASLTIGSCLFEIFVGVALGLSVSGTALVAELISFWISALLVDTPKIEIKNDALTNSLRTFILLVFLVSIFSLGGVPEIFGYLGESLKSIPLGSTLGDAGVSEILNKVFYPLTTAIFKSAFVFIVPFLVLSLAIDLSLLALNRYWENFVNSEMQLAIRFPALILMFSLSIYLFSAELSSDFRDDVTDIQASKVISSEVVSPKTGDK